MRVFLSLGCLAASGLAGVVAAPAALAADTAELPGLVPGRFSLQQSLDGWNVGALKFATTWHTYGKTAGGPMDDLRRPAPQTGLAARTVGKLFMVQENLTTHELTRSSCSGNVVQSANKSVVLTAGHCMKVSGAPGTATALTINAMFIPAFDGTKFAGKADSAPIDAEIAPYGAWVVTRAFVTNTWNTAPYFAFGQDMAALVVDSPTTTQPIQDVTGGQPTGFNRPRPDGSADSRMYVFGYPQNNSRYWYYESNNYTPSNGADPHPTGGNCDATERNNGVPAAQWRTNDGKKAYYTVGNAWSGPVYQDNHIATALSAGASGGPWFEDFNETTGTGIQTSVTSRNDNPNDVSTNGWYQGPNMVGTYFENQEQATLSAAAAVPTPNFALTTGTAPTALPQPTAIPCT